MVEVEAQLIRSDVGALLAGAFADDVFQGAMQQMRRGMVPRDGFAALRERLAALGERMPGKLVLVHGDTHVYHDDEPIAGVHRLEVWGSPIVSWMRGQFQGTELGFSAPHYR